MRCTDPFKVNEELILLQASLSLLLDVISCDALALAAPGAVQLRSGWSCGPEEMGFKRHPTDPRRGVNPARLEASRSDLQASLIKNESHTLGLRLDPEVRQQHSIRDACEAVPGALGRTTGGRPFDAEDALFAVEADLQFFGLV